MKDEEGKVDQELRDQQKAILPAVLERDQTAAAIAERASRRTPGIESTSNELTRLTSRRDEVSEKLRTLADDIKKLNTIKTDLQYWNDISDGKMPHTKLAELTTEQTELNKVITEKKATLKTLTVAQGEKALELRQTFQALVKRALSNDFTGKVTISEEGILFKIYRGESVSGEAYDTLSVLLADLSLLAMGAAGKAIHHGILIHDSPREADLGGIIYERFLKLAADLLPLPAPGSSIPIQYIVTTTTAPPEALHALSRQLGGEKGPLFTKQLQPPPKEGPSLFAQEPELFDGEDPVADRD